VIAPSRPGETMAITTTQLGKRYGTTGNSKAKWALRECTLDVPEGRICGLVGANGAGKTTLLKLLVGLARPSSGSVRVLGQQPSDTPAFLRDVGYLAQEVPLYRRWTAADHLSLGANLNGVWDGEAARERLQSLDIPLDQRVGTMSGGQRAQVALALALGKRPRLLLLDEPVAALDPLARREFLASLGAAVAESEGGLTVILSSHLVSDLERICDYLVVLAESRNLLSGDLDGVLASHRLLTSARRDIGSIEHQHTVLRVEHTPRQTSVWVRLEGTLHDPSWQSEEMSLEDIVLAYLARRPVQAADAPAAIGGVR
jgi:ABC-2 type transport system ATP-binding protein